MGMENAGTQTAPLPLGDLRHCSSITSFHKNDSSPNFLTVLHPLRRYNVIATQDLVVLRSYL